MPSEGKPHIAPLPLQAAAQAAHAAAPADTPVEELLSPLEQHTVLPGEELLEEDGMSATHEETPEDAAVPAAVVHRRTNKGRQSLKRLSDIMSAYIPVSAGVRPDRRPLLESHLEEASDGDKSLSGGAGAAAVAAAATANCKGPPQRMVKLLDVANLAASLEQEEEDPRLMDLAGRELANAAVSASGFVFLAFSDSPRILRLQLTQMSARASRRVFEVRVRGGARLSPIVDLKVRGDRLFVSGCVERPAATAAAAAGAGAAPGGGEHKRACVVARCDLDGRTQLVSKELPYPKFLGFDLDSDGDPVVASSAGSGNGSRDAQVFKMSGDFKRKLFKIQLGSRTTAYRPEFVACLPRANACWVATEQTVAGQPPRHRLLSFPLRCPAESVGSGSAPPLPTKAWMKVSSWKLDRVRPGRLLAVPSVGNGPERLLMISREQGNILCLSGEQQIACTALTHPVSDGGQFFTSLCCIPAGEAGGQEDEAGILATTRDSLYLLQGAWT